MLPLINLADFMLFQLLIIVLLNVVTIVGRRFQPPLRLKQGALRLCRPPTRIRMAGRTEPI